jgi:hypothetical protein
MEYLVAAWGSTDPHRVPWPRARQLSLPPVLQLRKSSAVSAPGLDTNGFVSGDRETFLVSPPHRCGWQVGAWGSLASAAELPSAGASMAAPGWRPDATSTGPRRGAEGCRRPDR